MKTSIFINVGLNNNPFTSEAVIDYFAALHGYDLCGYYIKTMTYNGQKEPTFVGWLTTNYANESKVIQDFENICSVMQQSSIAMHINYNKVIVYDTKTTAKYPFDDSLFESFKYRLPEAVITSTGLDNLDV